MRMRTLVRRYCEQDRTVLISRAMIHSIYDTEVQLTTQTIIKRGSRSVLGPTSVVEMYLVGSGMADAVAWDMVGNKLDQSDVCSMSLWDRAMSKTQEIIEDRLIGESTQRSSAIEIGAA